MEKNSQAKMSSGDIIESKYTPKRVRLNKIIEYIENHVNSNTLQTMKECSTFMQFIATQDKSKKKQVGGNSCNNRFCPICNWRKARKDGLMLSVLMQAIKNELNYEYIFLTLTVPNVSSCGLKSKIDEMNQNFNKMTRLDFFKKAVKGYVRKFEVTYNQDRDDYHPHFHVLLAVNKSYFTNTRRYINQEKWLGYWRKAMKDESITQVDVRKVKYGSSDNAYKEMAKYSTKDTDMVINQEVFDTLYTATKGKRLIVYSGIFKEYKKKYENKELDHYLKIDENIYYWFIRSTWNSKHSKYENEYEKLSDEQFAKFNNQRVDELPPGSIE